MSEFGSDWTHIDIRGASHARLLVHVARVRVLRTCVMQPSVRLRSAFPHAACAAKEHSFLAYPAIDAPYCSLQPDDAPSVTLCLCAALTTTASTRKPSKPSETLGGAPPPDWSSEREGMRGGAPPSPRPGAGPVVGARRSRAGRSGRQPRPPWRPRIPLTFARPRAAWLYAFALTNIHVSIRFSASL